MTAASLSTKANAKTVKSTRSKAHIYEQVQGNSTIKILDHVTSIIDEACKTSSLSMSMTDGKNENENANSHLFNEGRYSTLSTDQTRRQGEKTCDAGEDELSLSGLEQLLEPTPIASQNIQVVKNVAIRNGSSLATANHGSIGTKSNTSSSNTRNDLSDFIDLISNYDRTNGTSHNVNHINIIKANAYAATSAESKMGTKTATRHQQVVRTKKTVQHPETGQ